jgi:hypothetical protein
MRFPSLWVFGFLLLIPGSGWAQEAPVPPGRKVRVSSPAFQGIALVRDIRGDTLALLVENQAAPVLVRIADIERLELRRQNSTGQGAWKGVAWGLGIGTAFGAVNAAFSDRDVEVSAAEVVVSTGLVGGAIGAVWGALRPGGRWVRVPLPAVARGPANGGA